MKSSFFRKYGYYAGSAVNLCTQFKPLGLIFKIFLRRIPPGQYLIEIPGKKVKFFVRGVMDIWSVKETFIDQFYKKYGTRLQDGWTIIDIGGGIGDFTIYAVKNFPNNRVIVFEPTPESFALLKKNISLNIEVPSLTDGLVDTYNYAVWSENGQLVIDTAYGEPGQFVSVVESHRQGSGQEGEQHNSHHSSSKLVRVQCISLVEIFTSNHIQTCDILKIDAEGAEYPILFSTPDEVFKRIKRIVLEYHEQDQTYRHPDLEKFLRSKGYQVRTHVNVVHPDLGYMFAYEDSPHS